MLNEDHVPRDRNESDYHDDNIGNEHQQQVSEFETKGQDFMSKINKRGPKKRDPVPKEGQGGQKLAFNLDDDDLDDDKYDSPLEYDEEEEEIKPQRKRGQLPVSSRKERKADAKMKSDPSQVSFGGGDVKSKASDNVRGSIKSDSRPAEQSTKPDLNLSEV